MSEHLEQSAFFEWLEFKAKTDAKYGLIFAIPNGGFRHKGTAVRLKKEGVKSGVPDIFVPIPSGANHGLFIEMKFGKNSPTDSQKEWMQALHRQGYAISVCYSSEDAMAALEAYLVDTI